MSPDPRPAIQFVIIVSTVLSIGLVRGLLRAIAPWLLLSALIATFERLHSRLQGPLHSPWGLAQAPADFGPMSNAILVSNNIPRGRINAFDPTTGAFLGPLRDASGKPIEIDDVWALQFGAETGPNTAHNQLFFTAGPNNYANGLYGVIEVGP